MKAVACELSRHQRPSRGEPGDPFFFFWGQWSVVGRFPKSCPLSFFHQHKIRIFEDIKLMSLHQKTHGITWICHMEKSMSPKTLPLPKGLHLHPLHQACAHQLDHDPWDPGDISPGKGNAKCFHDCHDISCLSELCHTIFNIFNLTMTSLTRTHTSSLPNPKLVSTLSFVACVSR